MSQQPVTIPKQPVLKPADDFFRLRREGIGFIEQMGSRRWTDYNAHDPGITILEALCYALTDLAYRIGWDIRDTLTTGSAAPGAPYPDQAFFTAREILSVNPATPDDFRRLLIDLDGVRNAWVFGKRCACDLHYYAWCEQNQLLLSYHKPDNPRLQPQTVDPLGLYEVLLELEADPDLGDLNDRKIELTRFVHDADNQPQPVTLELRFPDEGLLDWAAYRAFVDVDPETGVFRQAITGLVLTKLVRSKTSDSTIGDDELRRYWRDVFFVSFQVTFGSGATLLIENAALRLYGGPTPKSKTTVGADPLGEVNLTDLFRDTSANGPVGRYRQKLHRTDVAVKHAKDALHNHRNLDEDYCRISRVALEDVAVCADVEVAPDADIERVQAQIWFEIRQYFNPPVPFHSLPQLMDAGVPVEDIINGPTLKNGYLKADELAAAGLKTTLRTSDIINRLMDIEGVRAVNHLLLSKYDAEGNVVAGAADPAWYNGEPVFNAQKTSASWLLFISEWHQPRLYLNQSRFLFYKNGLPFLPRMDEARDTLTQLIGELERPKFERTSNDLPPPPGTFRDTAAYFPVQYSLPATYGIGPEGLSSQASPLRQAQARQLKAYLTVFDQLLANAFAQISHTVDLFSLDPTVTQTYFGHRLTNADIQPPADTKPIIREAAPDGLTDGRLGELLETQAEFRERRNRFLDHLLGRFGEQFSEYARLLTSVEGQPVALDRLITDKISFLKAYPLISHDRGRAFNYRQNPPPPDAVSVRDPEAPPYASGLKQRISLLLGYPDLLFAWTVSGAAPGPFAITAYQLRDNTGGVWLTGSLAITAPDEAVAKQGAYERVTSRLIRPDAYQISQEADPATGAFVFRLRLRDAGGNALGEHPKSLPAKADADALRQDLLGWSSNERAVVVEHLLLRPKFPGDALFPACSDGECQACGDEDPYSFRLTFVMPGWTAPFNDDLDMRRFAERTIRQETPAHLLGKTCWVGNDGFIENPCDSLIDELGNLLKTEGLTADDTRPTADDACTCARLLYAAFSRVFRNWYQDKTLDYIHPDALQKALDAEFDATLNPADLGCTTNVAPLWHQIRARMVAYFGQAAQSGWQFERFEAAWRAWLTANAAIDWTEERLAERVEGILRRNVLASSVAVRDGRDRLCQCATAILTTCGTQFYEWMKAHIEAGHPWQTVKATPFQPAAVMLCAGFDFKPGTDTQLNALLADRYGVYTEVSYRLWVLVNQLGSLRNTYPGATLHDCDDGSDQNPVRLGSTVLGNYIVRTPAEPTNDALPQTRPGSTDGPTDNEPETRKGRQPRKPSQPKK